MTEIDTAEVERILEGCVSPFVRGTLKRSPILLCKDFQERFPGVVNVATFLDSAAITHYATSGEFGAFDNLGVSRLEDYLSLLERGHPGAVGLYNALSDLFGFR